MAAKSPYARQHGYTMIEVLAAMVLVSIMSGIAILQMREFERKSHSAASDIAALLKRARSKAITSVTTITVAPASDTQVVTTTGPTCAGPQSVDSAMSYKLPTATKLTSTAWSICYSNRGLSNSSANVTVKDTRKNETKTIEIVIGGGVRLLS